MRGTLLVVDDCTFNVTGLEITPGKKVVIIIMIIMTCLCR
jgi:hypothetical protein